MIRECNRRFGPVHLASADNQLPSRPFPSRPERPYGSNAAPAGTWLQNTIDGRGQIETELMQQCGTNLAADIRTGDILDLPAELIGGSPCEVNRANLMAKDDCILGLSCLSQGYRHLPRILRLTRRHGADLRHAASVESLIRDDESSTGPSLFMALSRVEVD